MKKADIIERCLAVHGDTYDYSLVKDTLVRDKLEVICKIHGVFRVSQQNHCKIGTGCQKCRIELHKESSVKRIINSCTRKYGDLYDYSNVVATTRNNTIIDVVCTKHGTFSVRLHKHLNGSICKDCRREQHIIKQQVKYLDTFFKVHGDMYGYEQFLYKSNTTLATFICKFHGEFKQYPISHANGHGCRKCNSVPITYNDSMLKKPTSIGLSTLYVILCKSTSETFVKIGITRGSTVKRFAAKKAMPYEYEIIHEVCSDLLSISKLEKELHNKYKMYSYTPHTDFSGYTECFSDSIIADVMLNLK